MKALHFSVARKVEEGRISAIDTTRIYDHHKQRWVGNGQVLAGGCDPYPTLTYCCNISGTMPFCLGGTKIDGSKSDFCCWTVPGGTCR